MIAAMAGVAGAAFDHLLVGIGAAPARHLDHLVSLSYKALAAGQLDETQMEALDRAAHARRDVFAARLRLQGHPSLRARALPAAPDDASRRRIERRNKRRTWGGCGALPHNLRHMFTPGENAVAAVVRAEVLKHGSCALSHDAIAKAAGLSGRTVVKRFMQVARENGLVEIEHRPVPGRPHKTNVVTIVHVDWIRWNSLGKSIGGTSVPSYQSEGSILLSLRSRKPATVPVVRSQGAGRKGSKPGGAQPRPTGRRC